MPTETKAINWRIRKKKLGKSIVFLPLKKSILESIISFAVPFAKDIHLVLLKAFLKNSYKKKTAEAVLNFLLRINTYWQ